MMRARILATASLLLFCATALLAGEQAITDKSKDAGPKKEPPKVTAATEINGKTLEQWIALIPGRDRSQTEAAVKSVLLYPPEVAKRAIPAMIGELKKHTANNPIDLSVRVNIPPALGLIISSIERPDPGEVKEAVAVMKKMLRDPQIVVKFRVTQALAQMGPMAKDTLPELVKLVKDYDTWETRHAAVVALGTVGWDAKAPPAKEVEDALFFSMDHLKESSVKVRLSALQSLNILRVNEDPKAKGRLQTELQRMANSDPDAVCHIRANLALFHLLKTPADKKKRTDIVLKIGKELGNPEAFVRMEAAQSLGVIGDEATGQAPALLKAFKDKDLAVMGWSMWAVGQMKYSEALPELRVIAADMNVPEPFRDTANEAIQSILGLKKKETPKKGNQRP